MSYPPMKLRINREGEFVAPDNATTESQCGRVGARYYRYFVSIEATNKVLTKEGFVMENMWVDDYFQKRWTAPGTICVSCEEMAQEAVSYFYDAFCTLPELKDIELTRILVRIHGSNVSFIEAEWNKPTV